MDQVRRQLTREQIAALQQKSPWRGYAMVVANWAMIVASFALVIRYPSIWAFVVAMIVLGGRHLGLGILMHECAHRSLVPSPAINDWVGQWLCAAPGNADLQVYRLYHMTHHVKTGTSDDPDLANYAGYPVSAASFRRKMLRDISGLTGVKAFAALMKLYSYQYPAKLKFGYSYKMQTADGAIGALTQNEAGANGVKYLFWNSRRIIVVNVIGFGILTLSGHPLAYLLWPLSWLTTYMVFSRIRNAAEHGGLPGTMTTDMYLNTRTVIARWWERLTVAPNYVNYHFEHHLMPTIPSYHLPRMHRWLGEAGALEGAQIVQGYTRVVRELIKPRAAAQ